MNSHLLSRIDAVQEYLGELREIQPESFVAFEQDKMMRGYTERMLHMAIDACIRLGIEILTDAGLRAPENYHDVFHVLGDHRILTPVLVNAMTRLVEFRNLLVYEHDVMDHMMIYNILTRHLDDIQEFIRAIHAYCNGELYVPSPEFEPVGEE
jgi:uncharacterized protein YutE (UPF0331/DUF86 family)